jgi:hypothetical protein
MGPNVETETKRLLECVTRNAVLSASHATGSMIGVAMKSETVHAVVRVICMSSWKRYFVEAIALKMYPPLNEALIFIQIIHKNYNHYKVDSIL